MHDRITYRYKTWWPWGATRRWHDFHQRVGHNYRDLARATLQGGEDERVHRLARMDACVLEQMARNHPFRTCPHDANYYDDRYDGMYTWQIAELEINPSMVTKKQ